jgi:hypothetical protein
MNISLAQLKRGRALLAGMALMLAHATAHAFPWYASGDNIWGAQLMSAEERQQHVQRVREMKSYEECSAYIHTARKSAPVHRPAISPFPSLRAVRAR